MIVAVRTAPTMYGRSVRFLPYITLSMRGLVDAGRIRPLKRLTIIRRKLPARSRRRGLMSFQISGMTFLRSGLGRPAVSCALAAELAREGRSTAFIPPPTRDGPKDDIVGLFYAEAGYGSPPQLILMFLQRLGMQYQASRSRR